VTASPKHRSDGARPRADTTRRQYDRWAVVYDWVWSGYIRATTEALLAEAHLAPGERVLNVGCGTGGFEARVLAGRPEQPLTGVDLSEKMIALAREKTHRAPNARFVQADAHDLPFADASFDAVVSASVLHYLAAPAAALGEMRRVARPGGRVVVLDWCRDDRAMRWMDALLRRVDPAHRRVFTGAEVRALLREARLAPERVRRFRYWWWGLMVAGARPGGSGFRVSG
jgi:ubiquinone/menaquinone biosynthesis C-methylase UbiE